MAQTTLVASFLLGALLVIGGIVLLSRGRFRYTPSYGAEDAGFWAAFVRASHQPVTWAVSFVVLTLLAGIGTVLAVGGFGVSPGIAGGATALLAAVGIVVFVGYLFYGTFVAARARGLHSAQAAAVGSWVVGLLLLVAVAATLVGFP